MAKDNLGLVHVYTGIGKGKTSASMGLAMRAVGQGLNVYIIQFMKGGAYTGELISAKNFLPSVGFVQYGKPCIKEDKQLKLMGFDSGYTYFDYVRDDIECRDCRHCFLNDDEQRKFVDDAFERAKKTTSSEDYDMIILDEINLAVHFGLLSIDKVVGLVKNKNKKTELILTGRHAHPKIIELGDYVSEMKLIKHPFQKGIGARRGIEY
ncbi:cob(I)yrinic acid a,c-diamide adenosyltransferase [Candidatus Woesearchaeota archaeon]|nr:cob(I)yrinic acid a,c-diamide adenosyltransferase [Candidatus Woesearchaeota archaeon]